MQTAPELPRQGLEALSPGRLIFIGLVLGFMIARLIEPTPPVRVVRLWAVPPPDLGVQ